MSFSLSLQLLLMRYLHQSSYPFRYDGDRYEESMTPMAEDNNNYGGLSALVLHSLSQTNMLHAKISSPYHTSLPQINVYQWLSLLGSAADHRPHNPTTTFYTKTGCFQRTNGKQLRGKLALKL